MAQFWIKDGNLVMKDGVLCYTDACPCGGQCACCQAGKTPTSVSITYSCDPTSTRWVLTRPDPTGNPCFYAASGANNTDVSFTLGCGESQYLLDADFSCNNGSADFQRTIAATIPGDCLTEILGVMPQVFGVGDDCFTNMTGSFEIVGTNE